MGDSGGTYTRSDGTRTGTTVFQQQEGAGLDIVAANLDAEANDMATALNNRLFKDGTNSPSDHINWLSTELNINSVSGSSSNYTASLSNAPSSYFTGLNFKFRPNHTNTGAATINVNSLGSKAIKIIDDDSGTKAALLAGHLIQGFPAEIYYDGTDFILINPASGIWIDWTPTFGASGGTVANGSIDTARYCLNGKKVTLQLGFDIDLASTPTALTFTLPVTGAINQNEAFNAYGASGNTNAGILTAYKSTTTVGAILPSSFGSFSDATTDSFRCFGTYEAA